MTFALAELDASPVPPLEEALFRARRVVDEQTGIVRRALVEPAPSDGPRAFIARSDPADAAFTLGTQALNSGSAASCLRDRAVMKAVGESIERYCAALPGDVVPGRAAGLAGAVPPSHFALFAPEQYEAPGFSLQPFDDGTLVGWVRATSLATGDAAYVPASMVYVPYAAAEGEARICDRISTGLACAHSRAAALAKGILEVVERDALMITWHNRLPGRRVRLASIDDQFARASLEMFRGMAVRLDLYCVTVDVPVPVVLGVGRTTVDAVPHAVIGLGTASDPARAVGLALEEVALGLWGMRVNAAYAESTDFESLTARGFAYATRRELASNLDFLHQGREVDVSELPRVEAGDPLGELRALTARLADAGLEPFGCDLTTEDVDDVGFKVCRVVVPGMRPLDIRHSRRHLGPGRLYDVPVRMGLASRPLRLDELNPDPHPFP